MRPVIIESPYAGDTEAERTRMRPFFTYYGGKWRAAPKYPAPLKGQHIIEPFAGAAGFSVRYADNPVTLIDSDENIVRTWRYLQSVSPAEILGLPDVLPGQSVDDLGVSDEAKILIGWWLNKGCAAPSRSPSAWMRGGTHAGSFWGDRVRQRIASQVGRIRHWTIIHGTYSDAPDVDAFWFVDPPYAGAGKHYRHGASGVDFGPLADWCRARRGRVVVCENTGADWLQFRHFMDAKANESASGGSVSREAIWDSAVDR